VAARKRSARAHHASSLHEPWAALSAPYPSRWPKWASGWPLGATKCAAANSSNGKSPLLDWNKRSCGVELISGLASSLRCRTVKAEEASNLGLRNRDPELEEAMKSIRSFVNGVRNRGAILPALLFIIAGTALPATAQQSARTQERDQLRIHQQDQDRIQSQDRDQVRDRIRALERQRKMDRDRLRQAERTYGKKSTQAQEARQQLERTRQQIRLAKQERKQVEAQLREQQRMQERERVYQGADSPALVGAGKGQGGGPGGGAGGGMGSSGPSGAARGGRGPR